jgi:hypothetical protein
MCQQNIRDCLRQGMRKLQVAKKNLKRDQSSKSCSLLHSYDRYQAGFAYLFTILLCVAYRRNWIQSAVARIRRYKRQHYQDIPDHDDSNAKGLPMFHMAQNAYTANPSNELWNRMVVFLKNFAKKWSKSPVRNKRRRE